MSTKDSKSIVLHDSYTEIADVTDQDVFYTSDDTPIF